MPRERILVVDDEPSIASLVAQALKRKGYECSSAHDGDEALEVITQTHPDLVILDLMLPGMDGWEVCRRVKSDPELKNTPILMLTARRDEEDLVAGLEIGADDYMKKPFSLPELGARVMALLRRTAKEKPPAPDLGALQMDSESKTASLRGQDLDLSPTEFRILEILAERMGKVVSREQLLSRVWDPYGGDTRTLDVHISRLRKKLTDGTVPALVIASLWGRGYRLAWEEPSPEKGRQTP